MCIQRTEKNLFDAIHETFLISLQLGWFLIRIPVKEIKQKKNNQVKIYFTILILKQQLNSTNANLNSAILQKSCLDFTTASMLTVRGTDRSQPFTAHLQ